jgi:hypothetical protein
MITAVLFIITAVLHINLLRIFGNTAAVRPVAAYGVIYLVLGILLLTSSFSWTPIAALVLTAIGGTAAIVTINANPTIRSWILLFIVIDIVIIALLIIHFFTRGG